MPIPFREKHFLYSVSDTNPYTFPLKSATNNAFPETATEAKEGAPIVYLHICFPVCISNAYKIPSEAVK